MQGATLLRGFPNLRQTYGHDCGPQALQSVLAYYGVEVREDKLIRAAHTTEDGTRPPDLVRALREHGLTAEAHRMNTEEVKGCINQGTPVILALQAWAESAVDWKNDWDDGHYAVAIGYDKQQMIFEDPSALRRTYLSFAELEDRWHDKDVDGKIYEHFGIAVYGKDPSPLREELQHMD